MKVTLLRHSETAGNLLGQYIGSTDLPLCGHGIARAQSMAARSDVDRVYTSGLLRTAQTAGILYPFARLVPCTGLNEMSFGGFEGKSWRDLENDSDYRAWVDGGCEGSCPGGENKADFIARCKDAFLPIVEHEHAQGTGAVYFVLHGGVIMAIMSTLARPIGAYFGWKAGFCGGYFLEYSLEKDTDRPLHLLGQINTDAGSVQR
jgi:alpha-ribazole phosphatase